MRYFLFRQEPNNRQPNCITSEEAASWDVVMILKSNSIKITPDILYTSKGTGIVYVHHVDEYKFTLMDAFGMPHANREDFSLVLPQEIFAGDYHKTVKAMTTHNPYRRSIEFASTRISGGLKGTVTSYRPHRKMG